MTTSTATAAGKAECVISHHVTLHEDDEDSWRSSCGCGWHTAQTCRNQAGYLARRHAEEEAKRSDARIAMAVTVDALTRLAAQRGPQEMILLDFSVMGG